MKKKSLKVNGTPKTDDSVHLEKSFKAIINAREAVNLELERMKKTKQQYEQAIEDYFAQIEKDPVKYRRQTIRGKKVVEQELTKAEIRDLKKGFRKKVVGQSTEQFFCDWDDCECPEESFCVRLNCEPTFFNACCYLCLSPAVIHCHFS